MERTLHIVGTLRAQEDATVAAQVAGQMEETRVDVGDRVTAGREMALIDTTTYQALARQSAANLAKALASAANAEQNLKRIQSLQNDKIASASEFDEAAAAAGQARAEVEAAKAADALVQLNLARSRVKAPFDGTVAERIASIGDYVAIGTPILRLVKTDPLRLRLEVPERESISVRVDQAVRLRVEGDTNVYAGRIARLSPALSEDNRMLLAEADVPNRGSLRPGLFARAEIVVNEREDGLSVPAHALITFAGIDKVVVVKDGKALEKTVTIGRRGSDWVEIVAGLAAGEAVVLEPVGLRSGQPVTVTDPTEPSKPTPAAAGSG
jgi:RND family efflux transporter MFP subunit